MQVSAKWPVRELQSRPADATGTPTSGCDNRPACGYSVLHPLKTYWKTNEYTKNLLQYRTMFCASCIKYGTPSLPLHDAFTLCTHYTNHRNKQLAKTRSIPEKILFITLSALVSQILYIMFLVHVPETSTRSFHRHVTDSSTLSTH